MKKFEWMISLILIAFVACGGGDDTSASPTSVEIKISPDTLIFDYSNSSQTVSVSATDEWGVSSDQSWCTCSPSGGIAGNTSLTVNVETNSDTIKRTATLTFKSGSYTKAMSMIQEATPFISFSAKELTFSYTGNSQIITVSSSGKWSATSDQTWCHLSTTSGDVGATNLTVTTDENSIDINRTATITFAIGTYIQALQVEQGYDEECSDVNITVPDGCVLAWHDEFNTEKPSMPGASDWWYETGGGGWGNNELENYVSGKKGTDTLAYLSDGSLKIYAKKINGTVYSIRMNTNNSWTYGYFEARLKLPKGKGSWPAFWMMPKNYTAWPDDGEIDIMEEVGVDANYVSCSIHCLAYYHSIGTQKTASKYVANAEGKFHVYALEWTKDYIKGYVDGTNYFTFKNDGTGNKATWPFNAPFYLKLNMAWGGDWGGYDGVDETALPLTYEIDYVRVFQKQ